MTSYVPSIVTGGDSVPQGGGGTTLNQGAVGEDPEVPVTQPGDPDAEADESVFDGAKWVAPNDVWVVTRGKKTFIVATVQLPGRRTAHLVYAIDPEDKDKFDFSKVPGDHKREDLSDAEFNDLFHKEDQIKAGNALELTGIEQGQTVKAWFEDTWRRYVGFNPVLAHNEEMARVYAEAMLEGWTDAEISSAVSTTEWYKARSQEQRSWALLSEAQKAIVVKEQAATLTNTYFDAMGLEISANDPFIQKLARQVSSAQIDHATATNMIRARASKDPDTPWAARVRERGRRGVNIEDKTGDLRNRTAEWGVKLGEPQLARWAQKINDLKMSDDDFDKQMMDLAESQWGSLEAGTSTRRRDTSVDEWAAPYMSSFTQLMEKGSATSTDVLFDRQFRSFLKGKDTVGDFEDKIRRSAAWRNTNNGKASSNEMLARVGQLMGYS